jgi:cell division protein FtsB
MREDQLPSELSDLAAAEAGIDAQREEIEGLQSENAALREEIESLRERWACVECGRTPDGGKSGDLYISICYGCHRCVEHAEPTCTVCAYDTEGMRLRNRDLLVQLEQAEERADRAEARIKALEAQVEELRRERDDAREILFGGCGHAVLWERAERAEARLAKVVEALADVVEDSKDGPINRGLNSIQNAEAALAAARGPRVSTKAPEGGTRKSLARLQKRVDAVLAQHKEHALGLGPGCGLCRVKWPCETVRILRGGNDAD